MDRTFDLFDRLGASDAQLDFPVVYASALEGWTSLDQGRRDAGIRPLLEVIVARVPAPEVNREGPFQLQVSALDYSSYVGVIGIGRVQRGRIARNSTVSVVAADGSTRQGRMLQILGFQGLERIERDEGVAGEIIAFTGLDGLKISDTICDVEAVEPLPPLVVDEPTIRMTFQVNDSPLAGREGKYVTSRNLRERLDRELIHNVALRVEPTEHPDRFKVSGRGELHLSILIESMRREGYELAISRPEVILREIDGEVREPWETLTVDVEEGHQGAVMEKLGERRGVLRDMASDAQGRVRLDYAIPSRGLIGFRSDFLTTTSGTGLMYHAFDRYGACVKGHLGGRRNGVLVSMTTGKALAYALFNHQERGRLIIGHGAEVYEGMITGIHRPRERFGGQPAQGQAADQHPRRRHRREHHPQPADSRDPRIRPRIHQRR